MNQKSESPAGTAPASYVEHRWAFSSKLGGEVCSGCGVFKGARSLGTSCPFQPEPPLSAWKDAVLNALAAWPGMDFKTDTDPALIVAAILRIEREAASDPRLHARAVADVLAERKRQVDLGWTPEHDDEHVNDEIAAIACYYLMPDGARDWDASSTGYGATLGEAMLPEGWAIAPGSSRRRDLVKAAALAIAEIERLDRADAAKVGAA